MCVTVCWGLFLISATAECCGVFAQYRFRCDLGKLGRFRKGTGFRKPGSDPSPGLEGCEPEVSKVSVFDGFRGVRFCSRGLDGTGSGNRVPGTRGIKKVPGSGDSVQRFRKLLCTSKVNFCTLKVYFCILKVYWCSLKI